MKPRFILLFVTIQFFVFVNTTQACSDPIIESAIPDFARDVRQPLINKGITVREKYSNIPGNDDRCIYSAVWIDEKIDLGGKIKVYLATYTPNDYKKISENIFELSADMIWYDPTADVDQTNYHIKDGTRAFGLTVLSVFIGGTFGVDQERFDLFADDGKGKLNSVLTLQTRREYERNCADECGQATSYNIQSFVVGKHKTNGFFDISLEGYTIQTTPTNEKKIPFKPIKYRWNGKKYIQS